MEHPHKRPKKHRLSNHRDDNINTKSSIANHGEDNGITHLKELIDDIRDKKELRTLDEDFVKNKLEVYFSERYHEQEKKKFLDKAKHSKTYKQLTKSKEYKFIIKELRAELRKVYGVFILEGYEKRTKILKEIVETDKSDRESLLKLHEQLFNLHKSTKERMDHYEKLYSTIFDTISDMDKSNDKYFSSSPENKNKFVFMDIACGLNPVSSFLFQDKIKRYYASDISTEDCNFLKEYFDTTNLDAIIFPADLTDEKIFLKLEKVPVDICLIFKTLDGLERIKRNISKDLLQAINTKYFAITFPTLSISAHREIKEHRRQWFERMLDDLGWEYEKFTMDSELLYIIKKGK